MFPSTTDGAPAVVRKQKGFVKIKDHWGSNWPLDGKFSLYYSSRKSLCQELNNVMTTVVNRMNFLVAQSALIHMKFQVMLEEMYIQRHSVSQQCLLAKSLKGFGTLCELHRCNQDLFVRKRSNRCQTGWWQIGRATNVSNWHHCSSKITQPPSAGVSQTVTDHFETWKAFLAKLPGFFSQDIGTSTFHYFQHLNNYPHIVPSVLPRLECTCDNSHQNFLSDIKIFNVLARCFPF